MTKAMPPESYRLSSITRFDGDNTAEYLETIRIANERIYESIVAQRKIVRLARTDRKSAR